MSFHLSHTPTLEAVANEDEQQLARDLQARVHEGIEQARAMSGVAEALASRDTAVEHLAKLRTAERALNAQAKATREKAEVLNGEVLDTLVEAAAGAGKIDGKKIAELTALEDRVRYAGRAIERLAERQLPLALIASLREESHALMTEGRAMEAVAQERAERVLGQIREAVSGEMVLPIDMSKGVAGALLAQAKERKERALRISNEADDLERAFMARG